MTSSLPLPPKIPVTIVTGFLGSGKTTLILNLLPQLPPNYKLALLKNEFGDVAVDSQLASSAAISGVQELLNGCICCNLVGQLSDALEQLRRDVCPDRIVIETSGSAFPATLAFEVNRVARETGAYVLDGVMSVIDVENWKGYEDTSMTAKLQARYTDLIVLNKHELVSERQLETCVDRILDLDLEVPLPRVLSNKGWVSKDIVFGLDANMSQLEFAGQERKHGNEDDHDHAQDHQSEVEVLSVTLSASEPSEHAAVDLEKLEELLREATKDEVYRIKAILYASSTPSSSNGEKASAPESGQPSRYILNWAFGRWTYTVASPLSAKQTPAGLSVPEDSGDSTPATIAPKGPVVRMTIMTARGESAKWKRAIERDGSIAVAGSAASSLTIHRIG